MAQARAELWADRGQDHRRLLDRRGRHLIGTRRAAQAGLLSARLGGNRGGFSRSLGVAAHGGRRAGSSRRRSERRQAKGSETIAGTIIIPWTSGLQRHEVDGEGGRKIREADLRKPRRFRSARRRAPGPRNGTTPSGPGAAVLGAASVRSRWRGRPVSSHEGAEQGDHRLPACSGNGSPRSSGSPVLHPGLGEDRLHLNRVRKSARLPIIMLGLLD